MDLHPEISELVADLNLRRAGIDMLLSGAETMGLAVEKMQEVVDLENSLRIAAVAAEQRLQEAIAGVSAADRLVAAASFWLAGLSLVERTRRIRERIGRGELTPAGGAALARSADSCLAPREAAAAHVARDLALVAESALAGMSRACARMAAAVKRGRPGVDPGRSATE